MGRQQPQLCILQVYDLYDGGLARVVLAIQMLGIVSGTSTRQLLQNWPIAEGHTVWAANGTVKSIAFWAFVIAFAIKVPVWPFHTWLPDAHTEAPTAGSMILAGVLKTGCVWFFAPGAPALSGKIAPYAGWLAIWR